MARHVEPVVLELAPLPREQVGPFLILGVDKSADAKTVEVQWAERVKLARRMPPVIKITLEDINWARSELNEVDQRLRCDASSLNSDTSEQTLSRLINNYGFGETKLERGWQPLDSEKSLADYSPPGEIPDPTELRQAAVQVMPQLPEEVPAVASLLEQFSTEHLDPWTLKLPGLDP